jgi:hypothetical protein
MTTDDSNLSSADALDVRRWIYAMDMQKSSSRANDSARASADFWVRSQKNPRLHAVAEPI